MVGEDMAYIDTEIRKRCWAKKQTAKWQLKDVFLSANEAQEDRVNIHHPGFYL